MFAKYGLILLVLLATGLAFVAGALLPAGQIPGLATADESTAIAAVGQPGSQAASAPNADDQPANTPTGSSQPAPTDKAQAETVPYTDLALPTTLPENAELGLQIGLFVDADQAQPLIEQLAALGQPSQVLQVSDPNGQPWTLLLAGPYPTLDQARTQRQALRRSFDLHHAPAMLLLPPQKKDD